MTGLQIEIFLLMAIGWWMGKTGRLSKQTWSQLTDLVIVVILHVPSSVRSRWI